MCRPEAGFGSIFQMDAADGMDAETSSASSYGPFVRLYPLIRPLAFAFDAERAHRLTIGALKLMPARRPPDFPSSLHSRVAGIDFRTPIGLAAGFDKDAEVPEQMLSLGFGFVEVGTLT